MRLHFIVLSAASIARCLHAQSTGTCYFANGTALPTTPDYNQYEPCTTGPTSICCGTNRALPPGALRDGTAGGTRDECMPNGLCRNRHLKPENNGVESVSYVSVIFVWPFADSGLQILDRLLHGQERREQELSQCVQLQVSNWECACHAV